MTSQDPKQSDPNKGLRNLLFILIAVAGIIYGLANF
jgi:hypothetical protein